MKALFFTADKTMELKNIDMPVLKDGQYLVKVKCCGICGSDFEGYMGRTGRRIPPMIMGHEFAGVIVKSPSGGKFQEGQSVIIFPKQFCGECEFCKKGLVNVCTHGISMGAMSENGAMCEYMAIDEKYIIPFSHDKISYNIASMTEPFAVSYHSIAKISDEELSGAENIIVIGAGTIGLLAIAVLKYRKASKIIACDTQDFRLDIAKKIGADEVINPKTCDFEKRLLEITEGKKCDFSVEAVGIESTAKYSLDALKQEGVSVWIGTAQKIISVDMQQIVTSELSIRGNYVYDFEDFRTCVSLLEEKVIDVSPLITNTYKLDDGVAVFKALENNKNGEMLKIILEM